MGESLIPMLVKILKEEYHGVDRAPSDPSYATAGRSPEATALAVFMAAAAAAAPVETEAPELSKEEKKAKWLADKAAKKAGAGATAVVAPVELTKAEKKEKWLADKAAAKKAAEATATAAAAPVVPELTKAEKKEQWLKEREEKKAALVAAAANKEEETKAPEPKTKEVKKTPATPVAFKQEEKVPPAVSVSHDEDLLLTLQVIMAHDIRSTTHTKEQFLHDMEQQQPVVKHDETLVDVSIPYMATAKLAFEQSDQALSYEEFERKYLAESVQEVMAKQQQ